MPKQPWRKKYRTAIILAAIGLVLFLVTVWLYPSTTQLPVPSFSTLAVEASQPVGIIQYEVDQVSSSIAEMKVTVQLPVNAPLPPAGTTTVELVVFPPIGVSFKTCPASTCLSEPERGIVREGAIGLQGVFRRERHNRNCGCRFFCSRAQLWWHI